MNPLASRISQVHAELKEAADRDASPVATARLRGELQALRWCLLVLEKHGLGWRPKVISLPSRSKGDGRGTAIKTAISALLCLFLVGCGGETWRASTLVAGADGLAPWTGDSTLCPRIDLITTGPPDHYGYGPRSVASIPARAAVMACGWVRLNSDASLLIDDLAATRAILDGGDERAALDYLAETHSGWCFLATPLIAVRDRGWALESVLDGCEEGLLLG